ncbi:MAG: glycosyltransferase family 4 protein [Chloroflexota bacterium]|nr:glycosyltransferase family 4 protein [Chloroflexota bacterium]
MRLCLLTGEYPPLQGGVGDYTACLAAALAGPGSGADMDVHVVTGASSEAAPPLAGVTVHRVVQRWDWGAWSVVRQVVLGLTPDVVHVQYQAAAYGLHPLANALPWLVHRLPGRPRVVTTFHDLLFPYLFPKAGPLRFQAVLAMARISDAVIVTNREDEARLNSHRGLPPVSFIPIGSNIVVAPPPGFDRAAYRAGLGVAPEETLLCYFGFVSAAKGGETLVRALALLNQAQGDSPTAFRLMMVGGQVGDSDPTNQAYLARVQALARELGQADRLLWTGYADAQETSARLLAADIAVLPYLEGANLRHGSLHACLAHGLPVVTTRPPAGGPPSALTDGENAVLVAAGDPRALAQAVASLADDPGRRARLGKGAASLARQFTWDGIAARHRQVYSLTPVPG